jgi:hypothetical protein
MSAHPNNPFLNSGIVDELGAPVPSVRRKIDSQAKGKRAERALAAWWREHGFPNASRAVKTGDRLQPDGGDLVLQHGNFRLVVEVKHHAGGLTDGQVAEYGNKLIGQVLQSKGDMGVLVERRDGVADPGRWWAHVTPFQFAALWRDGRTPNAVCWVPMACRTTVGYLATMLQAAGLTAPDKEG